MAKNLSTTYTEQPAIPGRSQYFADAVGAMTAAFVSAPLITAVDKAIAQSVAGNAKLVPEFMKTMKESIFKPKQFYTSKAFFWIWGLYSATYIAANSTMTFCQRNQIDNADFITWASTSAVNSGICIAKDVAFAKEFRTAGTVAKRIGMDSLATWILRDGLAILFFVTLPPIIGKSMAETFGNQRVADYTAQLVVPASAAFFLTPVNLLGYRFYNYDGADKYNPRGIFNFVCKDYIKNVMMKFVRIIPSWTIAAIINKEIKTALGNYLRKL